MMAGQNAPSAQRFVDRASTSPVSTDTSGKLLMHCRPFRRMWEQPLKSRALIHTLAVASGLLAASSGTAAYADLLIMREPDAIHIEARDVPLRQVLDAMQAKFNLHYRSDDALNSPVTGTFDGQLRRLVGRLLEDYDFVMKMTPEGLDVLIMQRNQRGIKPDVASFPAKEPAQANAPMTTAQDQRRESRAEGELRREAGRVQSYSP